METATQTIKPIDHFNAALDAENRDDREAADHALCECYFLASAEGQHGLAQQSREALKRVRNGGRI